MSSSSSSHPTSSLSVLSSPAKISPSKRHSFLSSSASKQVYNVLNTASEHSPHDHELDDDVEGASHNGNSTQTAASSRTGPTEAGDDDSNIRYGQIFLLMCILGCGNAADAVEIVCVGYILAELGDQLSTSDKGNTIFQPVVSFFIVVNIDDRALVCNRICWDACGQWQQWVSRGQVWA
jgi:hypothetical protein